MPEETPDPDDLLAPAEALATRLRAVPKLTGIEVIVDRQGDLDAMIGKAVNKAKGAAIVLALAGWDEPDAQAAQAQLPLNLSISLWTIPIMRKGAVSESIALGALVKAVHGWIPDTSSPMKKMYRWRAGAGANAQAKLKNQQMVNLYEFSASFEIILA